MQFFNWEECGSYCFSRRRGPEGLKIKHFSLSSNIKWKPMYLSSPSLSPSMRPELHNNIVYSGTSPPFAHLDIICKSPVDLHDDTSRHGRETCDASTEALLVMSVAGAATLCFPGWFWLSGEINAWEMMDTSLYLLIYWAVTAGIFFLWHSLVSNKNCEWLNHASKTSVISAILQFAV